jgi:hypothetical protein
MWHGQIFPSECILMAEELKHVSKHGEYIKMESRYWYGFVYLFFEM